MGSKKGNTSHRDGKLVPIYQGDQDHHGIIRKIKARTPDSEANNKRQENVGSDNLSKLCTWVDVAYAVPPTMKIHNGGGISFGYRLKNYKSIKQKLNIRRST